jgi:hypothetical protein
MGETASTRGRPAAALIEGDSFADSSGLIRVNVAGGSDNQQANLAAIAIGFEGGALVDSMLSQTRSSQEPAGGPVDPEASQNLETGIGAEAFENSSGIVQVSLIGGERNSSANTFALTVPGGAGP